MVEDVLRLLEENIWHYGEGDDYWTDPLKLQKQVAFIQKNNNCSLVFHPARCIYNNEIIRIHGPNIKKKIFILFSK